MEGDYLVVGIGCNVASHPDSGALRDITNREGASSRMTPREATCITEHRRPAAIPSDFEQVVEKDGSSSSNFGSYNSSSLTARHNGGEVAARVVHDSTFGEWIAPSFVGRKLQVLNEESQAIETTLGIEDLHKDLAADVGQKMWEWAQLQSDSAAQVRADFERNMHRGQQTLRDESDPQRAQVQPVGSMPMEPCR